MSTENPVLENFNGLSDLQALVSNASLEVSELPDGPLTADSPSWRCESSLIPTLGLTLKGGFQKTEFIEALEPASLKIEDVDLVVISEDPFLKEREVMERVGGADDLSGVLWKVEPGGDRRRSLENPSQGVRIGLATVLSRELTPEPLRPYRKGTVLAEANFFIRPYSSDGVVQPVALTPEVRAAHNLSLKTQSFVSISDELIVADPLDEAVTLYVEEDLLELLKSKERGDPEFQYVVMGVLINFLQQLTLRASTELANWSEQQIEDLESDGSVLIELISDKLGKINMPGSSGTPSLPETARMIKNDPLEVAAHLTALKDFTKHSRQLVATVDGSED